MGILSILKYSLKASMIPNKNVAVSQSNDLEVGENNVASKFDLEVICLRYSHFYFEEFTVSNFEPESQYGCNSSYDLQIKILGHIIFSNFQN